jgi:hypothetical protein
MPVVERGFHASSETAIALLDADGCGVTHAQRLGRALLAMVVLLYAFFADRSLAMRFASRYSNGYLKRLGGGTVDAAVTRRFADAHAPQNATLVAHVASLWNTLAAGGSSTPGLDSYYTEMRCMQDRLASLQSNGRITIRGGARVVDRWDACVQHILPSVMHMANNRIGVSVLEEAYLAYLLNHALATI